MKTRTYGTVFFIRDLLMIANLALGIYLIINKNFTGIIALITALFLIVMRLKEKG